MTSWKTLAAAASNGWRHRCRRPALPRVSLLLALLILPAVTARAEPDAGIILTVSDGRGLSTDFTRAALEGLGTIELATITPFTTQPARFTGVPLRRLLGAVPGETIHVTALDGYAVDIPRGDATRFDLILATRMDGETLPADGQGPLWVIYPWSQHPAALKDQVYEARAIWQVRSLSIR